MAGLRTNALTYISVIIRTMYQVIQSGGWVFLPVEIMHSGELPHIGSDLTRFKIGTFVLVPHLHYYLFSLKNVDYELKVFVYYRVQHKNKVY